MINLQQIKDFMRNQVERDRENKSVHVTGETLDDSLRQASIELGVPLRKLEYEVLQKGRKGFPGFPKKLWSLLVYPVLDITTDEDQVIADFEHLDYEYDKKEEVVDQDGRVYLRLAYNGAFLMSEPPIGKGKPAKEKDAQKLIGEKAIREIDKELLKKVVTLSTGEWVKIGEFIHNPAADAIMTVDISIDEQQAFIKVTSPGPGGADLSERDIRAMLRNNGIVYGAKEQAIKNFEKQPIYNENYLIAEGDKPVHGKDAKITYTFQTDPTKITPKEKNGKVDFKNLNLVQNVVKGQILARKTLAEKGKPGKTVTGKAIPARDGTDYPIPLGNNVNLSIDGTIVTADTNGQVLLLNGKITVETVRIITGDVGVATGNIKSLGTVIVKGNVEDGYAIEAAGNIEVNGTVGKADLKTEGDIIVHQGITGGEDSKVVAGQSVWSKFIQNATVDAGHFIVVSDGIMHSKVDANKKILCQGKRAKIVGGHLRAAEEVNASVLGAPGSAETIIEVGYDPKAKEELEELLEQEQILDAKINEIELNLQGLINQKRSKQTLDETKENFLRDLLQDKEIKGREHETLTSKIQQKQEYLSNLEFVGKISSSSQVFPGVKVLIKDAEYEVTTEFGSVTFINEGGIIRTAAYEEIEDDISRG
ncbi:FapA family protein [Spirochaeta cellobiosiphila]|uniref:FapA family protein n=1 Tax=Spirochaeta cellobiosiphila TaxID=504483 RepID=UPI000491BFF6|nr:FapA family protein [Spirochaeta cellobiosiphila]